MLSCLPTNQLDMFLDIYGLLFKRMFIGTEGSSIRIVLWMDQQNMLLDNLLEFNILVCYVCRMSSQGICERIIELHYQRKD
jgi:hypothetical protein